MLMMDREAYLQSQSICSFCKNAMDATSDPQLLDCFHSVCGQCVVAKKACCGICMTSSNVLSDHAPLKDWLNGVKPEKDAGDIASTRSKSNIAELLKRVKTSIDEIDNVKLELERTKHKLNMKTVLEPYRAKKIMHSKVEDSCDRTNYKLDTFTSGHIKRCREFDAELQNELKKTKTQIELGDMMFRMQDFVSKNPGLISIVQKSNFFTGQFSKEIEKPGVVRFKTDFRFGRLVANSFTEPIQILQNIIPKASILQIFGNEFKINVKDLAPYFDGLKSPLPIESPVNKKCTFCDFNADEHYKMIRVVLDLKQQIVNMKNELPTHLIVKTPAISFNILKVLMNGGWILKPTFLHEASRTKKFPLELDHEWPILMFESKNFMPRKCREAVMKKGIHPLAEMGIVCCTDNHEDIELLKKAGNEKTRVILSSLENAAECLRTLTESSAEFSGYSIIHNCKQTKALEQTVKDIASQFSEAVKEEKVKILSMESAINFILNGWIDQVNPLFMSRKSGRK